MWANVVMSCALRQQCIISPRKNFMSKKAWLVQASLPTLLLHTFSSIRLYSVCSRLLCGLYMSGQRFLQLYLIWRFYPLVAPPSTASMQLDWSSSPPPDLSLGSPNILKFLDLLFSKSDLLTSRCLFIIRSTPPGFMIIQLRSTSSSFIVGFEK